MVVFGTRPEAIKMCPVVKELQSRDNIDTIVCVTGQHREMLNQVLITFQINPNYDLSIMKKNQTLFDITIKILKGIKSILELEQPDVVLVHGDTTTTFATALACYYMKINIGHVEAGLRTYNIYSPYPEEFNRQAVRIVTKYHFAPTETAKDNLLKENVNADSIYVTGNTAIDALKTTIKDNYSSDLLEWASNSKIILFTAHRRENIGTPMYNMFKAIKRITDEYKDIKVIYPIHKNPIVRKIAQEVFEDKDQIKIIDPLDVIDFHNIMARSYLVLTDSGGIQEEAPSLGKPVLVMRNTTERPEGVQAGTLKLVGTNEKKIYEALKLLIENHCIYEKMSKATNPYGDGLASKRIVDVLLKS